MLALDIFMDEKSNSNDARPSADPVWFTHIFIKFSLVIKEL